MSQNEIELMMVFVVLVPVIIAAYFDFVIDPRKAKEKVAE
jgi:hypothetical protein